MDKKDNSIVGQIIDTIINPYIIIGVLIILGILIDVGELYYVLSVMNPTFLYYFATGDLTTTIKNDKNTIESYLLPKFTLKSSIDKLNDCSTLTNTYQLKTLTEIQDYIYNIYRVGDFSEKSEQILNSQTNPDIVDLLNRTVYSINPYSPEGLSNMIEYNYRDNIFDLDTPSSDYLGINFGPDLLPDLVKRNINLQKYTDLNFGSDFGNFLRLDNNLIMSHRINSLFPGKEITFNQSKVSNSEDARNYEEKIRIYYLMNKVNSIVPFNGEDSISTNNDIPTETLTIFNPSIEKWFTMYNFNEKTVNIDNGLIRLNNTRVIDMSIPELIFEFNWSESKQHYNTNSLRKLIKRYLPAEQQDSLCQMNYSELLDLTQSDPSLTPHQTEFSQYPASATENIIDKDALFLELLTINIGFEPALPPSTTELADLVACGLDAKSNCDTAFQLDSNTNLPCRINDGSTFNELLLTMRDRMKTDFGEDGDNTPFTNQYINFLNNQYSALYTIKKYGDTTFDYAEGMNVEIYLSELSDDPFNRPTIMGVISSYSQTEERLGGFTADFSQLLNYDMIIQYDADDLSEPINFKTRNIRILGVEIDVTPVMTSTVADADNKFSFTIRTNENVSQYFKYAIRVINCSEQSPPDPNCQNKVPRHWFGKSFLPNAQLTLSLLLGGSKQTIKSSFIQYTTMKECKKTNNCDTLDKSEENMLDRGQTLFMDIIGLKMLYSAGKFSYSAISSIAKFADKHIADGAISKVKGEMAKRFLEKFISDEVTDDIKDGLIRESQESAEKYGATIGEDEMKKIIENDLKEQGIKLFGGGEGGMAALEFAGDLMKGEPLSLLRRFAARRIAGEAAGEKGALKLAIKYSIKKRAQKAAIKKIAKEGIVKAMGRGLSEEEARTFISDELESKLITVAASEGEKDIGARIAEDIVRDSIESGMEEGLAEAAGRDIAEDLAEDVVANEVGSLEVLGEILTDEAIASAAGAPESGGLSVVAGAVSMLVTIVIFIIENIIMMLPDLLESYDSLQGIVYHDYDIYDTNTLIQNFGERNNPLGNSLLKIRNLLEGNILLHVSKLLNKPPPHFFSLNYLGGKTNRTFIGDILENKTNPTFTDPGMNKIANDFKDLYEIYIYSISIVTLNANIFYKNIGKGGILRKVCDLDDSTDNLSEGAKLLDDNPQIRDKLIYNEMLKILEGSNPDPLLGENKYTNGSKIHLKRYICCYYEALSIRDMIGESIILSKLGTQLLDVLITHVYNTKCKNISDNPYLEGASESGCSMKSNMNNLVKKQKCLDNSSSDKAGCIWNDKYKNCKSPCSIFNSSYGRFYRQIDTIHRTGDANGVNLKDYKPSITPQDVESMKYANIPFPEPDYYGIGASSDDSVVYVKLLDDKITSNELNFIKNSVDDTYREKDHSNTCLRWTLGSDGKLDKSDIIINYNKPEIYDGWKMKFDEYDEIITLSIENYFDIENIDAAIAKLNEKIAAIDAHDKFPWYEGNPDTPRETNARNREYTQNEIAKLNSDKSKHNPTIKYTINNGNKLTSLPSKYRGKKYKLYWEQEGISMISFHHLFYEICEGHTSLRGTHSKTINNLINTETLKTPQTGDTTALGTIGNTFFGNADYLAAREIQNLDDSRSIEPRDYEITLNKELSLCNYTQNYCNRMGRSFLPSSDGFQNDIFTTSQNGTPTTLNVSDCINPCETEKCFDSSGHTMEEEQSNLRPGTGIQVSPRSGICYECREDNYDTTKIQEY